MKALTSFGETDDLERLRSQYGKVAGALADVFHEAEQAGLRDTAEFEWLCQNSPSYNGDDTMTDALWYFPLRELFALRMIPDWEAFHRLLGETSVPLSEILAALKKCPRALWECKDYKELFQYIDYKVVGQIPYFREELYNKVKKDMPTGMLPFIFVVNKIGIDLERLFENRDRWGDDAFWRNDVGISVWYKLGEAMAYMPENHAAFYDDVYRFISWSEYKVYFDSATRKYNTGACDDALSVLVTNIAKGVTANVGRRPGDAFVRHYNRIFELIMPSGKTLMLPSTVYQEYDDYAYLMLEPELRSIVYGKVKNMPNNFTLQLLSKTSFAMYSKRKEELLEATMQYFHFTEQNEQGDTDVLADSAFISLMTTIWSECKRINTKDYVAGFVSWTLRKEGIDAAELLAKMKIQTPDLIHTVMMVVASRVACGDCDYKELLLHCSEPCVYARLLEWIHPESSLGASLVQWMYAVGKIRGILPPKEELNQIGIVIEICGKDYNLFNFLLRPNSFWQSVVCDVVFQYSIQGKKLILSQ